MSRSFRLSVLDQGPIAEGGTGGQALRQVVDLAKLAEAAGYHRYWIAEHHATPGLASASPESLLGAVGMVTSRIRLGTGGVMLPHYSAFKTAETFSMLSGMFPGRIDLGVGRAPGSDGLTAFALQRDRRDRAPDDFPQQLAEMIATLPGRPESRSPGCSARRRIAPPGRANWACPIASPISSIRAPHPSPPTTGSGSGRTPIGRATRRM
jgi:luciferase family oxidoreductase group 1